jgi:hypothetical protein
MKDADLWLAGMDLLRIKGEVVAPALAKKKRDHVCGNLYAGSILYLQPGAAYDVELTLTDPDGGAASHTLAVATKQEPRLAAAARELHVYPTNHTGERAEPVFPDLSAAYTAAKAGDHIVIHAGTYAGKYALARRFARDRPLVIRGAGDGAVVFSGETEDVGDTGNNCLDVSNGAYHWIEGITFRHYNAGVFCESAGPTTGLTVRRCLFEDTGWSAIFLRSLRSRDIYIADNIMRGTNRNGHPLKERRKMPYKGIWVAGQGIDVCYNLTQSFKDGISILQDETNPALPEFADKMCAIDFYNNDVRQSWDDNEADGGQHNIRFFDNRFVDMHVGLSAQPVYGGPAYFVRNVLYNITRGTVLKFNQQPAGVLAYHNTFVSYGKISEQGDVNCGRGWSNMHVHNNIFLGINGHTLSGGALDPEITTWDYNGYSIVGGVRWFKPEVKAAAQADEIGLDETEPPPPVRTGRVVDDTRVRTFKDLQQLYGYEQHMVELTFADLVDVPLPEGNDLTAWDGNVGDFRLKPTSKAVDAGMRIPNVNDGFTGKAPDLGACELGDELPHYGPRPAGE